MKVLVSIDIIIRKLDVLKDEEIKALANEFKDVDILFNCVG